MSFVKKIKDILFEDEPEDLTVPIKVKEPVKEEVKEEKITFKSEDSYNSFKEVTFDEPKVEEPAMERNVFRKSNGFEFPDFDEEEFATKMERPKPRNNALELERKKTIEKRNEHSRYDRSDSRDLVEKKKFKPSPIISPVYGVLNQDYRAEDIVNKDDHSSNISIEEVRKKAFEPTVEKKVEKKPKVEEVESINIEIDEPVVTFFDEKSNLEDKHYKTIDDLLEESSSEIEMEDTLEMPKTNNLDAIEEELEMVSSNDFQDRERSIEDTLDNDLFELIDSMYDTREEE